MSLDYKIPLLRAEERVCAVLSRLWKWAGLREEPKSVFSIAQKRVDWIFFPASHRSVFLALMAAMVHALREHAGLFTVSFGVPSLSVSLGAEWEKILFEKGAREGPSFCTFTGRGFSFQGPRALEDPPFALCTIQAAFADSLHLIVDELFDGREPPLSIFRKKVGEACFPAPISSEDPFLDRKSIRCFANILEEKDLLSYRTARFENFVSQKQGEIRDLSDRFRSFVLPSILATFKDREIPQETSLHIEKAIQALGALDTLQGEIRDLGVEAQAQALSQIGEPQILCVQNLLDHFLIHEK